MAKAQSIEEQVLALGKVRVDPTSVETRNALAKALRSKSNLLAAKAADLACELRLPSLLPDLEAVFSYFFRDGKDKGCVAKNAIARALEAFASDEEPLFHQGIRHVQKEGAWGGSSDVAVELRATCARALSRLNSSRALPALTDLLADPAAPARAAAAQAIGHCGRPEGALPLRLKIRIGDAEPGVMAECFAALLKLMGGDAIPVIDPFLEDRQPEELRDAAAIALGESRLEEAYNTLVALFRVEVTADARRALITGIALSRRPESVDLLLQVIDEEPTPAAAHAVESLAIYRNDPVVTARVRAAVQSRGDAAVTVAFAKQFAAR
jgi:HEAT repeat protein